MRTLAAAAITAVATLTPASHVGSVAGYTAVYEPVPDDPTVEVVTISDVEGQVVGQTYAAPSVPPVSTTTAVERVECRYVEESGVSEFGPYHYGIEVCEGGRG